MSEPEKELAMIHFLAGTRIHYLDTDTGTTLCGIVLESRGFFWIGKLGQYLSCASCCRKVQALVAKG